MYLARRLPLYACCFIVQLSVRAPLAAAEDLVHAQKPLGTTPDALNPQLTNIIESDSITLHYNGSGPVPRDNETSPTPHPISPFESPALIEDAFFHDIASILSGTALPDPCSRCIATTELLHLVAITQPVSTVTNLLVRICVAFPNFRDDNVYATDCASDFEHQGGLGPYYAQLFSKMNLGTGDMLAWCAFQEKVCESPPVIKIDESLYFSPKPPHAEVAPTPSGKFINVLHLSDWHLDSRYDIGSEANCTGNMCCRPYSENTQLNTTAEHPSVPASRFGNYNCDSPPDLALSAFSDMSNFFNMSDLAFSIFTGDIVSHDHDSKLSQAYVSYEEEVMYKVFKTMLGDVPLYATLGNHDTMPRGFNTPHALNPEQSNSSSNAMAWNYELVSSLWHKYRWLNSTESSFAATHYGAYATTTAQGLRIISFNADFWFRANIFTYYNTTNPDSSGILSWLAAELSACEARGQRAWLIAHVLSGYDGSASMPNPTALFYSIVRRFSPATIAAIFFGHTHQDQIQLFYDFLPNSTTITDKGHSALRDTKQVDFSHPLQIAYIGPSITPLTGLNSGYRVYQVDAETFDVLGYQTYIANMSNSLEWTRPVWEIEYDAREAYSYSHASEVDDENSDNDTDTEVREREKKDKISWPRSAPLNATFWHCITEAMLHDSASTSSPQPQSLQPPASSSTSTSPHLSLIQKYNLYESKSSIATIHRGEGDISTAQKVCYMRAGSAALAGRCHKTDKVAAAGNFHELADDCTQGRRGVLGDSWKKLNT